MPQYTRFVGIDVSKAHLDIHCLPDGLELRVANTRAGISLLLHRLGALEGIALGCEATGGYEDCLLLALSEAGRAAYCLHPCDIRAFARFKGKRAKTDVLDARAIAQALELAVCHRKPALRQQEQSAIKALTTLRRQLIAMRCTLKSLTARMGNSQAGTIASTLAAQTAETIKAAEAQIRLTIAGNAHISRTAARIRTVPGAGPVLAAELIGSMPELGTLSSRQAASLTGVAPHPRQSGNTRRNGRCQAGRPHIRRVLYMASLSIVRARKQPLAAFYSKLRAKGKPFKLAIVAIMRKLIVTLNAMIKTDQDWQSSIQT